MLEMKALKMVGLTLFHGAGKAFRFADYGLSRKKFLFLMTAILIHMECFGFCRTAFNASKIHYRSF